MEAGEHQMVTVFVQEGKEKRVEEGDALGLALWFLGQQARLRVEYANPRGAWRARLACVH